MTLFDALQPAFTAGLKGAIGGLLAAMVIDWEAFKSWNDYNDGFKYDWRKATFRWLKGTLLGLAPGAALALSVVTTYLKGG